MDTFREFEHLLIVLPEGPIVDSSPIESLLAKCWGEFDGCGETGMYGEKLLNRTENMRWTPPFLIFELERHGSTVKGSVYAELQTWTLNIEKKTAEVKMTGKVQVRAKDRPLKTKGLVEEIASLILNGTNDPRLVWISAKKVRIGIGKVIRATNSQTTSSRRKRFREDLRSYLAPHGWRMTSPNNYEHD
jgi:hypothetical protein